MQKTEAVKPGASSHRLDIQGLRAIAVVLVILCHANISFFSGGFVGVDVFFVLSGFLITGLLLKEHEEKGAISLSGFYMRRLRRLLPALVAVLAVVAIVVAFLFPQEDARLLLASIPFAASWTSNLFFALRDQDYFNELGEKDLFLHSWSLGVEEQFYLFWPLLLLAALSLVRVLSLRSVLLLLVVVSLLVSVAWSYWHPVSAFYMMPARIWQFGLGGLVCLQAQQYQREGLAVPGPVIAALSGAGLAMITGAAILLDDKVVYPGLWAIIPSLGAALVVLSGSFGQRATGIASAPLVWVGDRSYSLYLWHWPVLILVQLLGQQGMTSYQAISVSLTLTLLLSVVSYRWVELPFWKASLRLLPKKTFLMGAAGSLLFLLAVTYHAQRIPPGEIMPKSDLLASVRSDVPVIYSMGCDTWYLSDKVEPCVFGNPNAGKTAVLLGDSVGAQWFSAWATIFSEPDWKLVLLTKSACPVVDEDFFYDKVGDIYKVCRRWRNEALKRVQALSPDVVVAGSSATYEFTEKQWVDGTARVLSELSPVSGQILIVSGTPKLGFDGPSCIARHLSVGNTLSKDDCVVEAPTEPFSQVAGFLRKAADAFPNVRVFNPLEMVCPDGQCRAVTLNGQPVFRDSQHLTDAYVRSVSNMLRAQLSESP